MNDSFVTIVRRVPTCYPLLLMCIILELFVFGHEDLVAFVSFDKNRSTIFF